ncbi:hypothetical protein BGZ65_003095 [Modicella reniformis]|uniref:RRM domain-containing protein n=1 Tax=Modicella reniformis TaxID=1440133 RepID=A0A9P6J0K7_9FUNG|nr:hypothetical protein BGZ65_003095 [Modicella reniformis]
MASHTSSPFPSNPLTIRKPQHDSPIGNTTTSPKPQPPDEKRIYIGNLDPTIDEYAVLKLFTPFGKITKLDFMFHWHGPKKGTPRGYCFLEFETTTQAADAVKQMNRKAIRLRPLNVSLANMAPPSTDSEKGRKRTLDPNRPTAFSLLKAGGALKNASTNEKIRAMEKKLAQMAEPPKIPAPSPHASLPPKPTFTSRGNAGGNNHRGARISSTTRTTTSSSSLASNRHRPY